VFGEVINEENVLDRRSPIEALWADKRQPTLVQYEAACASGDGNEFERVHAALWSIDDEITAQPVTGARDAAIKLQLAYWRLLNGGTEVLNDLLHRILPEAIAIQSFS
jgi:hypothetical protein